MPDNSYLPQQSTPPRFMYANGEILRRREAVRIDVSTPHITVHCRLIITAVIQDIPGFRSAYRSGCSACGGIRVEVCEK